MVLRALVASLNYSQITGKEGSYLVRMLILIDSKAEVKIICVQLQLRITVCIIIITSTTTVTRGPCSLMRWWADSLPENFRYVRLTVNGMTVLWCNIASDRQTDRQTGSTRSVTRKKIPPPRNEAKQFSQKKRQ